MRTDMQGFKLVILGIAAGILFSYAVGAESKEQGEALRVREIRVVGPSGKDAIILSADDKGPSIRLLHPSKSSELDLHVKTRSDDSSVETKIAFKNLKNKTRPIALFSDEKNTAVLTMQDSLGHDQFYLSHNSNPSTSLLIMGEETSGHLALQTMKDLAVVDLQSPLSPGLSIANSSAGPKLRSFELVNGKRSNFKDVQFGSGQVK